MQTAQFGHPYMMARGLLAVDHEHWDVELVFLPELGLIGDIHLLQVDMTFPGKLPDRRLGFLTKRTSRLGVKRQVPHDPTPPAPLLAASPKPARLKPTFLRNLF
jgi:hypothetical protein